MPLYQTSDNKIVAWHNTRTIEKFRPTISKLILNNFGKEPLETETLTKCLFFTLEWYTNEFLEILKSETNISFYQGLFILHEYSCELHRLTPNISPVSEMSNKDFSIYRRVLKLCLEQACDIKLKSGEPCTPIFLKGKETIIEDLMYLGDFIYSVSNLLAQQHLVDDCIELNFTPDNQYYFDHKHHYGHIIDIITNSIQDHLWDAVVDDNSLADFKKACKDCLGVDFNKAVSVIQIIHNEFEKSGGKTLLYDWDDFPKNLESLYDIRFENGKIFYSGLTLNKENKLPINEAVYRPQNLNRYLYRPFLIWNVDGKDYTIIGDGIFIESITSICTNSIGWNKFPVEWANDLFKSYVNSKVEYNDKILEDKAEQILQNSGATYDRNIKNLKKWNNQDLNIDNSDCGEIDFLFIINEKLYIADSKHQTARYDMNNFRNDYSTFETGKKAYNKTLRRKVNYLTNKAAEIEEHFQVILDNKDFKLTDVEIIGIFIINTPTFIMFNNEFRMYTLFNFNQLIEGNFEDKKFTFIVEKDESSTILNVNYPYFKKPEYLVFDPDLID
jgi:hypothetical protein